MKKLVLIHALLLLVFFAEAGNDVTKKTLELPEFHSISVNSGYTVYIKQHNKQEVNVEALSEIYSISEFKVINGILHINVQRKEGSTNKSLWGKLDEIKIAPVMKVMISMKQVKSLQVNGTGKIVTENSIASPDISLLVSGSGSIELDLKGQRLNTEVSGPGSILLKGYTGDHRLLLSGTGKVTAYGLEVEKTNAKVSGPGICEINVSDDLQAEIYGDGQLMVKGNTKSVKSNIYGQGVVKRVH